MKILRQKNGGRGREREGKGGMEGLERGVGDLGRGFEKLQLEPKSPLKHLFLKKKKKKGWDNKRQ